jgi:hypothetical protein
MQRNVNVRPDVSTTVKLLEQSTDAPIIDADNLNSILSAEAINVAYVSLFSRTLLNEPENESEV